LLLPINLAACERIHTLITIQGTGGAKLCGESSQAYLKVTSGTVLT
jgi:hypothetical protein